jgi:phosphatidyl-myo-inositol alpha-mannosyltransferase
MNQRPLNICMLIPYDLAEDGGVKHHAFALAEALRRRGDRVAIVGPSSVPQTDPEVRGFGGVVNIQSNGSGNALGLFMAPWTVRRYFARQKFDVIHMHEPLLPSLPYWVSWLTPGTPRVATFHAFAEKVPWPLAMGRRIWSAVLFPFIHRGIAVSRPAETYARATWRRSMTVIPNGVSTRMFRPLGQGASTPATTPSIDAPLRLLFVGKLCDSRKGFRYLLDTYRLLLARRADVTLDIVGDRGTAPPPPPLPGLTYHGSIPTEELAHLYRTCDLFVAPSTGQESFGMVLLEAMASGRPVVCSDIEGYRQVVDEVGARLVPPRDPEALAAAIVALGADPALRRRMGLWNRRRAEGYDWERIGLRVREEYLATIAQLRGERYYPVEVEFPHTPSAISVIAAKAGAGQSGVAALSSDESAAESQSRVG